MLAESEPGESTQHSPSNHTVHRTDLYPYHAQAPEVPKLQRRLHEQLTMGETIPEKARESVERQLEELRTASSGKTALVVLGASLSLMRICMLLI